MPRKSKSTFKTISIALITVGAGLTLWGHQKSGGFDSQLSSALTGSHSDAVVLLYLGGAVCIVVGVYLYLKK